MRLGQFNGPDDQSPWCGIVQPNNTIINISESGEAVGIELPNRSTRLFSEFRWRDKVGLIIDYAEETGVGVYGNEEVERLAPVTDPQKIVCIGLNYRDHAEEGNNPLPEEPVIFAKFPSALTGPNSEIEWDPNFAESVDYEAELVTVIGREAYEVSEKEAIDYVAGFTVGNDISARNIQHGDGQWVRGKSLDTFAPIGPEIVTIDEIADYHNLHIWSEKDGTRLQDSSTSELIFGIDTLVSVCSQAFTLYPGDLIFTGTPAGVGIYKDPPTLLEDGDMITVGIEGIGELTNKCKHRN